MCWVQENYETSHPKQKEDFVRQTSSLVEEFLSLLLIIVSERHTPGKWEKNYYALIFFFQFCN
jgi:hypothetical protein